MERQCEEPHCLQIVPDHLFQSHQDEHFAERLAAEQFENQRQNHDEDEAFARAIGHGGDFESSSGMDADSDYQLALALNREIRAEEEERSFRLVQVHSYEAKSNAVPEKGDRGREPRGRRAPQQDFEARLFIQTLKSNDAWP